MRAVLATLWITWLGAALAAAPTAARADEPLGEDRLATDRGLDAISVLAGVELPQSTVGWRAEVSATIGLVAPPSERLDIDLHVPVGVSGWSDVRGTVAYSSLVIDCVPAMRVEYAISAVLHLYGQGGFGFLWNRVSFEQPFIGYQTDAKIIATLRFAPGLRYALSPALAFVLEPLGLNLYFTGSQAIVSFMAGVAWTP